MSKRFSLGCGLGLQAHSFIVYSHGIRLECFIIAFITTERGFFLFDCFFFFFVQFSEELETCICFILVYYFNLVSFSQILAQRNCR